jgi:hypothetical protein
MPTAVERLLDSFLKFDTVGEQLKLDNAFQKIDEALLKLSDVNGDGFNFLKIEHDLKLQETFNVIGEGFLKVGIDFQKVDTALKLTDQFVIKLMGDIKIGDLLPAIDQDFSALDQKVDAVSTDIKYAGLDFLKLGSSPNQQVFDHKIQAASSDFLKLGTDTSAAAGAFLKLGEDFIAMRKAGGDPKLLDAYEGFGDELVTIGQTLDTLAGDFLKLGDALHGAGGGGGAGDAANTIGGTLTLIYQEFHLLDQKFEALGDGSVRLISELVPAVQQEGGGPPNVFPGTNQHGGGGGSG